jgi:hypothetical protein
VNGAAIARTRACIWPNALRPLNNHGRNTPFFTHSQDGGRPASQARARMHRSRSAWAGEGGSQRVRSRSHLLLLGFAKVLTRARPAD